MVLTTAMVLLASTLASAGTLLVDGSLTDWGIQVLDTAANAADKTASNFNEYTGISGIGLLGWMSEDTNDLTNSLYLGPNNGGQNYDAEFMAAALQGDRLFLAIVSGQRPDNGASNYAPGDIRIETGSGVYGIEVGGGAYGSGDAGLFIVESAPGTTYSLYSSGHTSGVNYLIAQVAGSVWRDATWQLDPIAPGEYVQQITGGTEVGTADYHFTRNSFGSQHSIIELSLPVSYIGGLNQILDIYWRPSCGNDELHVGPVHMPLPGALVPGLVTLAIVGACGAIRRRAASRSKAVKQ
jgi:hypothetical protein